MQAEGSCALYRAFENDCFAGQTKSNTIADSLAVDVPKGGFYALKQLKRYGGRCITVSDDEILEAQKQLASEAGLFAEPAAAAALAGFLKAKAGLRPQASIVLLITGSGLKDIAAAARKVS